MSRKKKKELKKDKTFVTFDTFFLKCTALGVLKPYQGKEIYTFFRDKGLRDKEDIDIFEKVLKEY